MGAGGAIAPPNFKMEGQPPLALNYIMNKFNLLFLLRARVLNSVRMKRKQVLLNESCMVGPALCEKG